MSAATSSHDERTRTSTPPIDPIRSAPGSFALGGRAESGPVRHAANLPNVRAAARRRVAAASVGGLT